MFTDYNGKRIVESVAVKKSGSYSIPVLLSSAAEQPAPTSHSHLFGLNAADVGHLDCYCDRSAGRCPYIDIAAVAALPVQYRSGRRRRAANMEVRVSERRVGQPVTEAIQQWCPSEFRAVVIAVPVP